MELKLLYLCDGPYHSVLFQTHLWLGILYSFYCKSLEAEELLFHSVLHPSFLALSSPAFFHILPFFCIFEEGDMLFLYYLESSVCARTPPHTHTLHDFLFILQLRQHFSRKLLWPLQTRTGCPVLHPHRPSVFPSELLYVIICLSLSLSIKSGIIVSPLYPQPWQNAWYIEGVPEWINKSSMPICYMDEWMVVWSVIVPKSKRSC